MKRYRRDSLGCKDRRANINFLNYLLTYLLTMSVRLYIPARAHSSKPAAAGSLVWARCAGDIDRLQQQRRAAGSATLSAYVAAEHRLVMTDLCRPELLRSEYTDDLFSRVRFFPISIETETET